MITPGCIAQVLANDGSGAAPLADSVRNAVLHRVTAYGGAEALRCLALACKTLPLADAQARALGTCSRSKDLYGSDYCTRARAA